MFSVRVSLCVSVVHTKRRFVFRREEARCGSAVALIVWVMQVDEFGIRLPEVRHVHARAWLIEVFWVRQAFH